MRYESIVVGTDGSASALETVRRGAGLARTHRATLHIVAAYRELSRRERERTLREVPERTRLDGVADPRWAARAVLEDAAHTIRHRALRVVLHAVKGDPASALCEVAERVRADVIVVGNRGAGNPFRRVIKPIYDQVQRLAPCEVQVVDTEYLRRPNFSAGTVA
jgi:nucleotide-binding universal stress UspA family protein